jgi:hypothetical protein
VAQKLGERLKQSVVVENVGGAAARARASPRQLRPRPTATRW